MDSRQGAPDRHCRSSPHPQCHPWVSMVCHGTPWESTVFPNKTVDFENDHAPLLTPQHLVIAAPNLTSRRKTHWRWAGTVVPRHLVVVATASPEIAVPRPMSRRPLDSARPSEKGTGDPIGSPAPSPFSVVRRLAYPRFTPYPGSRPRQTAYRPHRCEPTRSGSPCNSQFADPHGCPPETALIPTRSAKASTVEEAPDGV